MGPGLEATALVAADLVKKGRIKPAGDQWPHHFYASAVYDAEAAAKPDWIWLPNAIVDGVSDETAPLELVRQTQDASTLRLLIDLYHGHALASDGGIHWRRISKGFTRHRVGQRGPFVVYGFEEGTFRTWTNTSFVRPYMTGKTEVVGDMSKDTGWPVFWKAWTRLVDLGLVEVVGHLIEADSDEGNVIHPYAIGCGEPSEQRVARAAAAAAETMLTEEQRDWAASKASGWCRFRRTLSRLPWSASPDCATAREPAQRRLWYARMTEWDALTRRYEEMAAEARGKVASAGLQHQGRSK